MKASTVLKKARTLIARTGHLKGEMARNKYRHKVDPTSPSAVKFCAFGALHNVLSVSRSGCDGGVYVISRYLRDAIPENGVDGYYGYTVDQYNDRKSTTPLDVDIWFARAIALAKKAGN